MGKWGQSTGFSDNYSIFKHILLGRPPFRPPKPSILAPPWSLPRRQKDDNRGCCPISRLPQQHLLRSLRMALVDTTCLYVKISFMTDPKIGWFHTVNANLYIVLGLPGFYPFLYNGIYIVEKTTTYKTTRWGYPNLNKDTTISNSSSTDLSWPRDAGNNHNQ